jgi:thioredoxin 1
MIEILLIRIILIRNRGTKLSSLNISPTGITFVKFEAEWCGPCKLLDTEFHKLDGVDGITIQKYDIDVESELTESLNIMGVPTVMCYRDGEYIGKFVGAVKAEYINNIINGTQTLEK